MPGSGERRILVLLALASMPFAFVNTLFTQTVSFAADDFGRNDSAIGFGAALVRWGVVIVPPIALFADRIGRRRVLVAAAWLAPVTASLGAIAPTYNWLVFSQTVARPLALVINVMILVVLTEETSRSTRARSLGLIAIASSIGAGVAVAALPLADLASWGWRIIYLLGLLWLPVAYVLQRHIHETSRFTNLNSTTTDRARARISWRRLATQFSASLLISVFVATASVYLVNYLRDVRNYDAWGVTIFTTVTTIPAGLGLIAGGRWADRHGRRHVGAGALLIGSLLVVASYSTAGATMWATALLGGVALGVSYPALGVYRGELFPTARRSTGASLVTASGLIGGSLGLVAGGLLLDAGWSYSQVMGVLVVAPAAVSLLVLAVFPETAQRELEDISPDDVA